MSDRELTAFLSGVVGVVEANSFEQGCLWERYTGEHKAKWIARNDGLLEGIGTLDGMPICLSLRTADVNGNKLLFIDATSQVVDHRQIGEWLSNNLPPSCRWPDGRINKVDAMNFHNVFRAPHELARTDNSGEPGK